MIICKSESVEYFNCDGDGSWLHRGLLIGSLLDIVIVCSGSYLSNVTAEVCLAAFCMLHCTRVKQKKQKAQWLNDPLLHIIIGQRY